MTPSIRSRHRTSSICWMASSPSGSYRRLEDVRFVASLPKTGVGKLDKKLIRKTLIGQWRKAI